METLKDRIKLLIREFPGLTDRDLTDRTLGTSASQQAVNQSARALAAKDMIQRRRRPDGRIGNFPANGSIPEPSLVVVPSAVLGEGSSGLCEDDIKRSVKNWLEADGWHVDVRWGRDRGIDVDARRGDSRWVIEAKGCGSRNAMRVNYFIAMLGETLQRMEEPMTRYSIALPDLQQFRGLWARLPQLAKARTEITALFISETGTVTEVQ